MSEPNNSLAPGPMAPVRAEIPPFELLPPPSREELLRPKVLGGLGLVPIGFGDGEDWEYGDPEESQSLDSPVPVDFEPNPQWVCKQLCGRIA